MDIKQVEEITIKQGYNDYQWISGAQFIIKQWVRFKCMFGCDSFGKKGSCPPSVPSIQECREFLNEYANVLVIHLQGEFPNPEDRKVWSRDKNLELLKLERAVFLAGFPKAFLLFMDECRICSKCAGPRLECKNPQMLRPGPEALGVDVFSTVRAIGYPIEVLTEKDQKMNRYAFLLVE